MTHLPQRITVQLIPSPGVVSTDGIVISLQLFRQGQPYYGTVFGMSDAHGVAVLARRTLQSRFEEDQAAFPMDYRDSLNRCDPRIEFIVRGEEDFAHHLRGLAGQAFLDPGVLEMYKRAGNRAVRTVRALTTLPEEPGNDLVVDIVLTAAG